MDDTLIAAVYRREPLWDPAHKLHRHVNVLKSLWEEVAEETGRDVKIIKTRWKNLRAYYVKECQKIPKSKNGIRIENFTSTWQYFQPLNFLGTSFSNVDKPILDENTDDSNSTSLVDVDDSFDVCQKQLYPIVNIESGYEFRAPTPHCKRLRSSLEEPIEDNHADDLERTKIELLQRDADRRNNDDLLFFESLLPYVKDIPVVRKLRLRSAIQDLITKELEELAENNGNG
ncbi:transcription factor Adf-1-like [Amyelois transitella]|uniref:transcription factor Adf-1-like n=1 Tax=Amyelois transitella TaxID=680683 RepID=UPI00298F7704|nr:transcription factor Adf-1-like [Amyelois transitella]